MAVPVTPITANLDEAFDVKITLFSKLTLNLIAPVNYLTETINLIISEVVHLGLRVDAGLRQNLVAQGTPNAMNILQGHPDLLISGYIYSSDTWHLLSPYC